MGFSVGLVQHRRLDGGPTRLRQPCQSLIETVLQEGDVVREGIIGYFEVHVIVLQSFKNRVYPRASFNPLRVSFP